MEVSQEVLFIWTIKSVTFIYQSCKAYRGMRSYRRTYINLALEGTCSLIGETRSESVPLTLADSVTFGNVI